MALPLPKQTGLLLISLGLGVAAVLLAVQRVDHGNTRVGLRSGPGLTLDEGINAAQGGRLAEAAISGGPLVFLPDVASEVFAEPAYLPDYPPLGRFLLGLGNHVFRSSHRGVGDLPLDISAVRVSSCVLFGCVVTLLVYVGGKQFGTASGVSAGILFMTLPRTLGHARLASLETATTLTWTVVVLWMMVCFCGPRVPTRRQSLVGGFLFGLLLLTKVQAILMPPLIILWALIRFRFKAVVPLLTAAAISVGVFFLFWPWLWQDPWQHLQAYLGRATDRLTIYVWYFGTKYADRSVPWHYCLVMLLTTLSVPVLSGLAAMVAGSRILFGRTATIAQRTNRAPLAWLTLTVVGPLVIFSLPSTPVYDGTRLFQIIMPALCLIAAYGFHVLAESIRRKALSVTDRVSAVVLCLLCVGGWIGHSIEHEEWSGPFAISWYNSPRWAESLGLESSYWGDGLTRDFWRQVAEGSEVRLAPVLHQYQVFDLNQLVPLVKERGIRVRAYEYDPEDRGLILTIHRLADLRPAMRRVPPGATVVAETRFQGRVLARLIDTSGGTWSSIPTHAAEGVEYGYTPADQRGHDGP